MGGRSRGARSLEGRLAAGLLLAATLGVLVVGCGDRRPAAPSEELFSLRTLGLAYLEENRNEQAAEAFERLTDLAPREPLGWANLGVAHLRMERPAEAVAALEQALRWDRDHALVRYNLALGFEALGREGEARSLLEGTLDRDAYHVPTLLKLVEWEVGREEAAARERVRLLRRLKEADPGNIAVRLPLIEALLDAERPEEAAEELEEFPSVAAALPAEAEEARRRALRELRAGESGAAAATARVLQNHMLATPDFQAGYIRLHGPVAGVPGIPLARFAALRPAPPPDEAEPRPSALSFRDVTAERGLEAVRLGPHGSDGGRAGLVTLNVPGSELRRILAHVTGAGGEGALVLLEQDGDGFVDRAGPSGLPSRAVSVAVPGDVDNDGLLDIYFAAREGEAVWVAREDGTFERRPLVPPDVTRPARARPPAASGALFADLDQTGHVDLLVAGAEGIALRINAGDGSWRAATREAGFEPDEGGDFRALAYADFDDDGVLDLFLGRADGPDALYRNLRGGRFEEVARRVGLELDFPTGAAAVGDADNDGALDLFRLAQDGSGARLDRNRGGGQFERDDRSAGAFRRLAGLRGRDARFVDLGNDGHQDLVVVGEPEGAGRGLFMFRNDGTGRFHDASDALPDFSGGALGVAAADFEGNGALDLLVLAADGSLHLFRNDGATANHHLAVRLRALEAGAGRVNRLGLGSTVEVRAGDLYQRKVVTGPVTHFGLGGRDRADVVRVVWTNGVPQNVFGPAADQTLLEEQVLKGSCPFLYVWNGEGYEFVTDVIWRNALGMPIGIMGSAEGSSGEDGAAGGLGSLGKAGSAGASGLERILAPPGPAMEYVRIPSGRLVPHEGRYRVLLTEELWETAYVDELKLLLIDHPSEVEVRLDERFVPPRPPELRLWRVGERHTPVAATDGRGTDLLPYIEERDDIYTPRGGPSGPYQGLVEPHHLVLDLGPAALGADSLFLFLQGWIFPTDASINVAVARRDDLAPLPPRIEVPDGRGGWRVVVEDVGFPAGKDKTVAVDLSGRLPPGETRLRLYTNMDLHWDHVFFTVGPSGGLRIRGGAEGAARVWRALAEAERSHPGGPGSAASGLAEDLRLSVLRPVRAELRPHGFSRMFRKGRHGPHWFDGSEVSAGPRWRDLEGLYTRYGDVLPLLLQPDSRYAVLNSGDGIDVAFDAEEAPDLPESWERTFVLYTVGWVKDGDLNTAAGDRVEPLPFHFMSRYPYGPGFGSDEAYPDSPEHRRFLEEYQTREVTADPFRRALRSR